MVQYGNLLKKTIISRSTKETEIIALDTTTSEPKFLKNLLCDWPLLNKPITQISMKKEDT